MITPSNYGTDEEPILEIYVIGRVREYAECNIDDCKFSYLNSETPEITSIDPIFFNAGDIVTVEGTLNGGDLKADFD